MSGKIYCITNIENRKKYIGQTHRSIRKRLSEHCGTSSTSVSPKLKNAIKKYGKNKFVIEVLWEKKKCTDDELNAKEMELIKELNTLHPNGYNLTIGGSGGRHSDETKELLSEKSHKMWNERGEELRRALIERNSTRFPLFRFSVEKTLVDKFKSLKEAIDILKLEKNELVRAIRRGEILNDHYFSYNEDSPEIRTNTGKTNGKPVYCFNQQQMTVKHWPTVAATSDDLEITRSKLMYAITNKQLLNDCYFSFSSTPPPVSAVEALEKSRHRF
jgi:group I intron endonuclease